MEICVLGGFGSMGSSVVKALLKNTDALIRICDRQELDFLKKFPSGKDRISFRKVDVLREETIGPAIAGCNVAINCIGPSYRYGVTVARAVIQSGISGIDVCNDSGAVNLILALDREAKQHGVTWVTGLGFSPGLSNLFAMKAAQGLESVDKISIGWVTSVDELSGRAQLEHLMYTANDSVSLYRNRIRTRTRPFSDPEEFKFPYPIGYMKLSHVGNPEVITLPDYLDVNEISVKGGLIPVWAQTLIRSAAKAGIYKDVAVREKISSIFQKISVFTQFHLHRRNLGNAALKVSAQGIKKGYNVRITCATIDKLDRLGALPVVTGAVFLANGEIEEKGVFPPEGCIDEDRALSWMSRCGLVYTYSEKFLPVP